MAWMRWTWAMGLPCWTACTPDIPLDEGWTVGVYMAADNNLDPYATRDLDELTDAGVPAGAEVLVLLDRSPRGAFDVSEPKAIGLFEDARLLRIVGSEVEELEVWGELDMGDPDTLERFATVVADRQTDHNALVMWDHGGGTIFATDKTDGKGAMRVDDAARAIGKAFGNRRRVDVVGFDACLMASQSTLVAMPEVADIVVASPELEPGAGWPYDGVMQALKPRKGVAVAPEVFAAEVVDAYGKAYAGRNGQYTARLGAWWLDEALEDLLDDLAEAESAAEASDQATWWRQINRAVSGSLVYGAPEAGSVARYVDLGDLLLQLERSGVADEASAVRDAIRDHRIALSPTFDDDNTLGVNLTLESSLRFEVGEVGRFAETIGRAVDAGDGSVQQALATTDTAPPQASLTGVERAAQGPFEVVVLDLDASDDVGFADGYLALGRGGDGAGTFTLYGMAGLRSRGLTALDTQAGMQLFSLGLTADAVEDGGAIATLLAVSSGRFATVAVDLGDGEALQATLLLDGALAPTEIVLTEADGTAAAWSIEALAEQGATVAPQQFVFEAASGGFTVAVGDPIPVTDLVPTIVPVTGDDIAVVLSITDVAGNVAAVDPVRPFDLPAP